MDQIKTLNKKTRFYVELTNGSICEFINATSNSTDIFEDFLKYWLRFRNDVKFHSRYGLPKGTTSKKLRKYWREDY